MMNHISKFSILVFFPPSLVFFSVAMLLGLFLFSLAVYSNLYFAPEAHMTEMLTSLDQSLTIRFIENIRSNNEFIDFTLVLTSDNVNISLHEWIAFFFAFRGAS